MEEGREERGKEGDEGGRREGGGEVRSNEQELLCIIHIYMYIYIHTHTHTHTQREREGERERSTIRLGTSWCNIIHIQYDSVKRDLSCVKRDLIR